MYDSREGREDWKIWEFVGVWRRILYFQDGRPYGACSEISLRAGVTLAPFHCVGRDWAFCVCLQYQLLWFTVSYYNIFALPNTTTLALSTQTEDHRPTSFYTNTSVRSVLDNLILLSLECGAGDLLAVIISSCSFPSTPARPFVRSLITPPMLSPPLCFQVCGQHPQTEDNSMLPDPSIVARIC